MNRIDPTGMLDGGANEDDDFDDDPGESGALGTFFAFVDGVKNMVAESYTKLTAAIGFSVMGNETSLSATKVIDSEGNASDAEVEVNAMEQNMESELMSVTQNSDGDLKVSVLGGAISPDGETLEVGTGVSLGVSNPDGSLQVGVEVSAKKVYNINDYNKAAREYIVESMKPKSIKEK